ncbi:unnamed protein product [Merluccius merluccius]
MRLMAEGLMARYKRAGEAPPELLYVDRGCCRVLGVSSLEQLFSGWAGMLIRLAIFHWIHRFDAAISTDHHPKFTLFKSALSGAVFAYNRDDSAIEILKGASGMDENQVHLFKDEAAIDHVWENQQKHLECIQDPLNAEEEEVEEEEAADAGYTSDREGDTLTPLRKNISLTNQAVVAELDPCVEDVCGPNQLPGYEHVEELSKVLVNIALEEGKLAISNSTKQKVITAWNKLDLHDRYIQQFDSLYSARWRNALFSRTNGDPAESSLIQKLKFSKRYSAAHLLDSRKNRLMYCLIKQLWLHPDSVYGAAYIRFKLRRRENCGSHRKPVQIGGKKRVSDFR